MKFLRPAGFFLLTSAWAVSAPRWEEMDYGPFLSSSVTMQAAKHGEDVTGIVMKGVTVPLKLDGKIVAAVCFDTMLCRWAGGWLAPADGQPALKLYGTPFDGTHRPPERSRPRAHGEVIFQVPALPGWAHQGSFEDPRENPYVPLARERAHYTGLYRRDDRVFFCYTVGRVEVMDTFSVLMGPKGLVLVRELQVAPHAQPLRALLDFGDAATAVKSTARFRLITATPQPAGAKGGRAVEFLPATDTTRFRISYARAGAEIPEAQTAAADFALARQGGPARYAQPVITQGELGQTGAAYEVDRLALPVDNPWKAWMRPGGFDFFADGQRAALCTWSGDVWIVSGLDGSMRQLSWRRIATGLFQPLGLRIVGDQIYVLGRDQITRLHDLNGDGESDFYENFNNDVSCTPNFHEFATDLQTDSEGNFYFVKNAPLLGTAKWDPSGPHNGCVVRVSRDGGKLDVFATGIRAANGCSVGPNGVITTGDNEGIWTPVCRLNWVRPGMFLGAVGMDHRPTTPVTYDPPLCWLPFAVDNSVGGQVWAASNFGPLSGRLLHSSYGKSAVFNVLHEEVNGIRQGGVVKLPWKFDSSVMRARIHPDGSMYVAGLRGWGTAAAQDGAFHRVRYTGREFAMVTGLRARPRELELSFNVPLDRATATDVKNYDLQQWNYLWSEKYGSEHYSPDDPTKVVGRKGELTGDPIIIEAVTLSPDGKTLTIVIPRLRPVMQMLTRASLKTASGEDLPIQIAHTINVLPGSPTAAGEPSRTGHPARGED